MSRGNLNKALNEFLAKIDEINGLYHDVSQALMCFNKKIQEELVPRTSIQNTIIFGDGDPNDPKSKQLHSTTVANLLQRTGSGMQYDRKTILNLCIIAIYQYWEDEYREKIAQHKGFNSKSDIKSDLFGEIRYLRQAIIHNKGKRIKVFDKLNLLNFVKDRDSVYFSENEFNLLISLIKDEIENIKMDV